MNTNQEIQDRILFLHTILIQTTSITELLKGELTVRSFTQIKVLAESNERILREIEVLRDAMHAPKEK